MVYILLKFYYLLIIKLIDSNTGINISIIPTDSKMNLVY